MTAVGMILLSLGVVLAFSPATAKVAEWIWTARIATPWDYPSGAFGSWEEAVDQAIADGANVILDWHAVSNYWQALYEPLLSQDLAEMRYHAHYIHTHHPGVRYIIYVAPLEYVTRGVDENGDGQVDPGKEAESLALQHPDWAQVGIDGRRAVFYGAYPGMPFWVCETCEDVWITPANPEYRALVLEQARRIAATGIDGVWFDVPFLRFDFGENWQEQWPTFDPWARARFQAETGYILPQPPVVGWPNWDDPVWRAFVRWRYTLTASFIQDYQAALQQGNPNIKLIIETSVGPDVAATQQGSSTLDLPAVSDLTAHEHGGPWRSSEFHYYMWLRFLADLLFFSHTDGDQPSWLLSYVKADEPDTLDVARLHAAMVLSAGMNYYTSGNETMSGMPHETFRRQFFAWLAAEELTYYDPSWHPYGNVALIYSQQTLDYLDRGSWQSTLAYHDAFTGMAMMLLESHIPFEVISERELARLSNYDIAILPLFAAMSPEQAQAIRSYVASGGKIIATGPTSLYDKEGVQLADFQLADVFGVHYSEVQPGQIYVNDYGAGRSVFLILTHELDYFWAAKPWGGGLPDPTAAEQARQAFLNEVWSHAQVEPILSTPAPRGVILLPYRNGNKLAVRALNFQGVDYSDAVPTLTTADLTLKLPSGLIPTTAQRLEFLGGWQPQNFSQPDAQHIRLSFPLSIHAVAELELNAAELFIFRVSWEGNVSAAGAFFSGQGADIAEWVLVSEPVEPGDLLEIDPEYLRHYRKACSPYSQLISGVVSSSPGIVLGGSQAGRKALLALIGTVMVKAIAENGPIKPGDLLVSASLPGHVMRCDDPQRCEGAIIGKALEPLEQGIGIIKVLVMN